MSGFFRSRNMRALGDVNLTTPGDTMVADTTPEQKQAYWVYAGIGVTAVLAVWLMWRHK